MLILCDDDNNGTTPPPTPTTTPPQPPSPATTSIPTSPSATHNNCRFQHSNCWHQQQPHKNV
eukprot:m.221341 g.221341  ORF g.221341 m.221341 type:complete len:62 (-) comp33347_c0_seq1:157-342(-)